MIDQPTITKEQIDAYREQCARRCLDRIREILQEENCELLATPALIPDGAGGWRLTAEIKIVPR